MWHIEKDIVTKCNPKFKEEEDWSAFFSYWTAIIYSTIDSKFDQNWKNFEIHYAENEIVLKYIKMTWLPYNISFLLVLGQIYMVILEMELFKS